MPSHRLHRVTEGFGAIKTFSRKQTVKKICTTVIEHYKYYFDQTLRFEKLPTNYNARIIIIVIILVVAAVVVVVIVNNYLINRYEGGAEKVRVTSTSIRCVQSL